jgi:hypothetical protein
LHRGRLRANEFSWLKIPSTTDSVPSHFSRAVIPSLTKGYPPRHSKSGESPVLYTLDASKEGLILGTGSAADSLPASLKDLINCVRKEPIASIKSILDDGFLVSDFFSLAGFLLSTEPSKSVEPVIFSTLIHMVENLLLGTENETDRPNRTHFYGYGERSALVEKLFSDREKFRYNRIGSASVGDPSVFSSCVHLLKVNLDAPDSRLMADFAAVLRFWRETQVAHPEFPFPELTWKPRRKKPASSRPWTVTSKSLLESKVIPFLDLLIWEEEHGCKISVTAKSQILFPKNILGHIERKPKTANKSGEKLKRDKTRYVHLRSLIVSLESQAWSLMDGSNASHFELSIRATDELLTAYRKGIGNRDFVPTPSMLTSIEQALSS